MDRYLVVSSDGHAGPHAADYREYVSPKYRDAFDAALPIQIAMTETMAKQFLVDDINRDWRQGNEDGLQGAWDHAARNRVIDADGVAAEVLFPDGVTEMNAPPFGAGFSMPAENTVPELQWEGCRAHNRWLAEFVSMEPARRIGLACIPVVWDIEEAVKEIHAVRDAGLRGIILPTSWGSHPAYHHPRYDPVWATCQDLEIPVHFHSGQAPIQDYFGPIPPAEGAVAMPGAMGIYVSEVCWWVTRPLTFMIWGGAFERFPKLKVAITEGTTVWVPEYLKLLDHRYEETHYAQKLGDYTSHLKSKPSEYFARNVKLGASCMPRREAERRFETGLSQIMWGTDYPHPEGSWPFTRKQMTDTFRDLPEDEIAAMLGGNAVDFYNLDLDALRPIAERIGPERSEFKS
ncbi:MAG: amidohydrolase family protein [Myxococcota bacterium]